MFQIDKDHPPSVGPISQRYKWCCNNGCGECTPVLVEFRTYHSTLNGATDQERTEPRMVSRCCGEGMFLWDTPLDDDGPMGYDGALARPPQKTQQPALSTAPNNPPMPEHWGVVVSVNGDNILCIGEGYLHGKRELSEAEENAVIGVAQHLLAFVGHGLPPSSFDPDADDAARTVAQPVAPHEVATQPTTPSMTLPAERSLFKEQFRHLDLEEVPDAWGRPMFKHSHVDAIWNGWRQRAAVALLDTCTKSPPTAQAAESAPAAYSIDADPQGIRAMVADAITGALAFGAQGSNPPPEGHWLAPFWNAARSDHSQADSVLKGHQIAALVNELRDIAVEFHGTQQLRERIAQVVVPVLKVQKANRVLEDAAPDHIRALIAQHAAILDQNESAYFELAYHRVTGWMAWITDKPLCMPPVINPDRKVLAQGQGDTAEEACADAALAQKESKV